MAAKIFTMQPNARDGKKKHTDDIWTEAQTLGRMAYILWAKMKNKLEINLKFVSHFIGVIYLKRN